MWENVFLLILTSMVKIVLTAWTFGMMVILVPILPLTALISLHLDTRWNILAHDHNWCMSGTRSWITHVCSPCFNHHQAILSGNLSVKVYIAHTQLLGFFCPALLTLLRDVYLLDSIQSLVLLLCWVASLE